MRSEIAERARTAERSAVDGEGLLKEVGLGYEKEVNKNRQ